MFNESNKYSKYVVGFIAFAFTLIQGVDFVLLKLGIETNYLPTLLVLLIIAFFIGLVFVWRKQDEAQKVKAAGKPTKKKWTLYLNIFVTILLGALFVYYFQKGRSDKQLLNDKLPEIVQAYDENRLFDVYAETKKLIEEGNTNPVIKSYFEKVTQPVSIVTDINGVEVSLKRMNDSTGTWSYIGTTPLDSVRIPNGFLEYKFEGEDFSDSEFAHTYYVSNGYNTFNFPKEFNNLKDHVLFLGGKKPLNFPGVDHLPPVEIGPFSMSKFEVTNKEYKEFLDQGGYGNPEYWDFPYQFEDKELTFESTVKTFVDGLGQTGPAGWSYGNYPEGQADFPVTGISWFEARAYAKYKGLSIPNIYQWAHAAILFRSSGFVPKSNFSKNMLVAVGSINSNNPNQIFDIAGNAREWVINSTDDLNNHRGILGGGYTDDPYYFNDYYGQHVLDRSLSNGIRLVKNLAGHTEIDESPEASVAIPKRDFLNEETVSDEVFEIFREQFNYPDKPLHAKLIPQEVSSGTFKVDRFEVTSAYEKDGILPGYIFYDGSYKKPLKPIIYFPGSNAIHHTNVEYMIKSSLNRFSYLMKEGYAVILPIYLSTYERADSIKSDYPNESEEYKDHVIKWGKDYRRAIDYVFSRDDMDSNNLTYLGSSWGGFMANTLLAIDDRMKSATLYVGGLCFQKSKKEVEAYHYTSRITIPVQMLNGKYDQFFPLESSQIPMFELLGTPEEDKKHYVAQTGHFVPRETLIKEHLAWLKKYEEK